MIETAYQPSHKYTALYTAQGVKFQFRVYDRLNIPPYGFYYDSATGGINIQTAQYTPWISVQKDTLSFPLTNVGSTDTLVDSIASYGEQSLEVDSVWIGGPTASDFRIVSQNGNSFTLGFESANKFSILYSPSKPLPSGEDTLYIHSRNADGPDKLRKILLSGSGAAPNAAITPGYIDFGLARVGTNTDTEYIYVYNSGNGPLIIDSITIVPNAGTPDSTFTCDLWYAKGAFPDKILGGNPSKIILRFAPAAQQCYRATAKVYTSDGKVTLITLVGCGAEPIFNVLEPSLNFGTVFTHNQKVLYDTVRNDGNWTEHVTHVEIQGPGRTYFTFQPDADTNGFFLNAGDSRIYAITFRPSTTSDQALSAQMIFYFEEHTTPAEIRLFGNEKRPRIVYSANFVDFGKVKIGNTEPKYVGVKNASGDSQVFIYNKIQLGTGEFSVAAPIPNIFGFDTDNLTLAFKPNLRGPASAWLHIQCNQQDDSIYMIGLGAIARPVFSPDTVSFQACSINDSNYASTNVRDTGDYPLVICDLQIAGPDASEFTFKYPPKIPDTVKADGIDSRTYGFNFTMHAYTGKIHTATLKILYCVGSADSIPLWASEAEGAVTLLTNRIDFGTVRVGKTLSKPAVFANTDPVALPVDRIWTSSSNEPFSAFPNTDTVPAKSSNSVSVTFAPLARGNYIGYLNVNGIDIAAKSIVITGIGATPVPVLSRK